MLLVCHKWKLAEGKSWRERIQNVKPMAGAEEDERGGVTRGSGKGPAD